MPERTFCAYCGNPVGEECICARVDAFFEKAKDVPRAEPERCLACFFAPCRCQDGLKNK